MRLLRLAVSSFGTIDHAQVSFGPGLNVLYGPNDLGKSTLAAALRAVLLVQPQSSAAREFVPWSTDRAPSATLTLELDGRIWRVHKTWSSGSGRTSTLEWSNDGQSFTVAQQGRGVDGELRRLLGWGIPEPGGRGGKHGLPRSFLSTVLLGEQALPYRLFDRSLAEDHEDSGRHRLTEALQAMAADPLFADVLGRVQGHVDEAFTQTGRRKQSKTSPFKQVADEIRRRHDVAEELSHRVGESEAVARRLTELDAERDRRMTQRAEAAESLDLLEQDLKRLQARHRAGQELAGAKADLEDIERNRREIEQLATAERAARDELPGLEAMVEGAEAARAGANAEAERLRQAARSMREGGDADAKLRRNTLESKKLQLRAQTTELEHRLGQAEGARRAVEDADGATVEAASAAAAQAQAQAALEEAERRLEALEIEERQDTDAIAWLEARRADRALLQATEAAAEAQERHKAAGDLRARAKETESELATLTLPDAVTMHKVAAMARQLDLAIARLGGGVSVRVERSSDGAGVQVGIDGAGHVDVPEGGEADAQRELEISVGGTRLRVVAGEQEARTAVRAAQSAWHSDGETVLNRAGLHTVEALEEAFLKAQARRAQAREILEEAATLQRLAGEQAPGPQELEARHKAVAMAQARIEGIDCARAETRATEVGEVLELRAGVEDRRDRLAAAREAVALARSALAEARAQTRVAQQHVDSARTKARTVLSTIAGDPASLLEAGTAQARALLDQGRAIEAELEALEQGNAAAIERADAAAADAERHASKEKERETIARQRVDACRDALASARGQLSVRREQASGLDPLAAAERFAALQDAFERLPAPEHETSPQQLEAARLGLERADRGLDEALAGVRKQEGALQHIGGQVVREKAEAAREALEAARRREAEIELEYEGWRLLLETLREAENEEGQHLGRALGRQVGERFEELTRGRYGSLELGPELEARGLQTRAAGVQSIDSLSEGLKEQLATILRVSVAQQLEGALLLDDHLTQTDPARVAWFRDLLRTAAASVQIVVMTCRPDDYLDEDERPVAPAAEHDASSQLHAVALERVIERISSGRPA